MTTEALNAALSAIKSTDAFAQARARAIISVYHEVWGADRWKDFEVVAVEHEFSFPLMNPDTEGKSQSFVEAGKMDVLLRRRSTGRLTVLEHKTTSDDVGPESDYWLRLKMDGQVLKYDLGARSMGEEVQGVLYDVMGKPAHRPSQIPLLDADGVKIVMDANGERVRTKDGKKWRESADSAQGYVLKTRPETPDEFEARLIGVLREQRNDYFAQKEVPRLDSEIIAFMEDEWNLSQQILHYRSKKLWPRNPNACTAYNRTCEFFDLCTGRASVDGIRYHKVPNVHNELRLQRDGDRQLLTNSRVSCLRQCARKHFLHYEEGVRRVDGEEAEALHLGTLIHLALEAYFNHMKENQTITV